MICNKFHNFAAERVSLKERNTFYIPFPTGISCRKEGVCRGWTLKDEIDDHCSQKNKEYADIQTDTKIGMNYKYTLFSKIHGKKGMANEQDKKTKSWYVMRAYKNEKTAEKRLSDQKYGLEHFIPKQKVLRTINGKKVICMVPVIPSLVFVYANHEQIVDFKLNYYNDLQFVTWKSDGELIYLTVPDEEMTNFIKVCEQTEQEVHFYKIDEINKGKDKINIEKGKRVRVHGGPFDQVEGYFMKVAKKRGRQLVVIIPDLLVVSAEVEPEYIQIID